MCPADWVLRDGRLVTPEGIIKGGLAVSGERISAIGADDELPPAAEAYDAGGQWVFPGGVDSHVHIHYQAPVFRGDFGTETAAAVLGGTTTVADFCHGGGAGLQASFDAKRGAGERLAVADFGLHAVLRAEADLDVIPEVLPQGLLSVKIMMANPNGIQPIQDGLAVELFRMMAEADGVITVHAENEPIQAYLRQRFQREGRAGPMDHALARPEISEGEAISRAILFARYFGTRLHVFHLSSALGADLVAEAKARGVRVTVETCPQYLLFTQEDIAGGAGPFLQVNPSIKLARDRARLWGGLQNGDIDAVVSDHYGPLKAEKEVGWTNIWDVEGGVPGIESRLAVLWQTGVVTRHISVERFVALVAANPARIFGLYPKKGALRVGSDADLVVWDPERRWTMDSRSLHQTADWTPFAGLEIHGGPVLVMVRGRTVAREGELLAAPGSGRFIAPARASARRAMEEGGHGGSA